MNFVSAQTYQGNHFAAKVDILAEPTLMDRNQSQGKEQLSESSSMVYNVTLPELNVVILLQ